MKQGHGINSIIKMNTNPFPHTIIHGYLDPKTLLSAYHEMKKFRYWGIDDGKISSIHQKNKRFTPWCKENLEDLRRDCPLTFGILTYLNSPTHIRYLENLTSIPNLLPDPSFSGGGIHRISTGGKLDIHADYNIHPETGLHRRVNLLIYFTPDWEKEWGGELELWERDMSKISKSISPEFNTAVIFAITDDAFHGHPHPLRTPDHIDRYSLALYYFTKERPVEEIKPPHAALWQNLPTSHIFEV